MWQHTINVSTRLINVVWGNTTTQNRLSQSLTTSELTNRLHPFTTQHVVVGLIHHHRLPTLHPHSRTSLQHTDESSHRSVGYRRLNYNALSHSCFINHSDWPATKHKPWTQSWLANTILFIPKTVRPFNNTSWARKNVLLVDCFAREFHLSPFC